MAAVLKTGCGLVFILVVGWLLYRRPALRFWSRWILTPAGRWLPRLLTACSVILVPWLGVLIVQLHGAAGTRSFASSWIGLDVAEIVGLLLSALLIQRGSRVASPVAAATATVLAADAWFDLMSAAPKFPYAQAMFLACFAELPLAVLLGWASWQSLSWAAGPGISSVKPKTSHTAIGS